VPDPRFFETLPPLRIEDALDVCGAQLRAGDPAARIARVAAHDEADLTDAAIYLARPPADPARAPRGYGLCIVSPAGADALGACDGDRDDGWDGGGGGAVAVAASPRLAFARLAAWLYRPRMLTAELTADAKTGAAALDRGVRIHETAVIAEDAEIGAGARIGPFAVIGPGVVIGAGAVVEAGAVLTHALVGANVVILSGARIGQAGFGFEPGPEGLERVPQLGRVVIGDNVEIGANTTIDRGALGDTVIGEGCKIDNLVQIGHNVRMGRRCVLAAQTGISGSCIIGDDVFMGGQVGLADHLTVGDGAQIAAGAGLMRDAPAGEKWGGRPARPARDWLKETALLAKIAKGKKTGKT